MRNEQFVTLVNLALKDAVRVVEKETLADYTDEMLRLRFDNISRNFVQNQKSESIDFTKKLQTLTQWNKMLLTTDFAGSAADFEACTIDLQAKKNYPDKKRERVITAYFNYNSILNDVILSSLINLDSDVRPLQERISYPHMTLSIRKSLDNVGILEPFSYQIYNRKDELIGSVGDHGEKVAKTPHNTVRHNLFEGILLGERFAGYIELTFYEHDKYIKSQAYVYPMLGTTVVLFILCIMGIFFIIRQMIFERNRKNFIDNLTHELKTPLTSIMIASDMLSANTIGNSPQLTEKLLTALKSEVKRLSYLVDKVLQFTTLDQGKIHFFPIVIDVEQTLQDAHTVYSVKCKQLGGKMTLELNAPEHWIKADKIHFQNIIFNLIDNAVKYRKQDVPPEITLSTQNIGNTELAITVKDNGIGIAKIDRERIFRKYYRVQSGNVHDVRGFGLGLSYVKKTVETMKGRIKIGGKKGIGTEMTIILPIVPPESDN